MVRILGFLVGLGFVGVAAWSLLWGVIACLARRPAAHGGASSSTRSRATSHSASTGRSAASTASSCSAASRSIARSAPAATASAWSRSATCTTSAIPRPRSARSPTSGRSRCRRSIRTTGEPATRKALPADRFPSPYANEVAARAANNNALPPDLSLITKAREGGPAYIASLLTGYQNAAGRACRRENRPGSGLHFNPYFANLNIAMPPPLTADGQVTYADGTAGDARADGDATSPPSCTGRPSRTWSSATRWASRC